MKSATFTLVGVNNGLVMHSNYVLADPLHPVTQRIKQLVSNRKKTDEDIAESFKLEFTAGLYLDADKAQVVMPGDNVFRMLCDSAAKVPGTTRKRAEASLQVRDSVLHYVDMKKHNGTTVAESLWASNEPSFRLIRPAKLNGKSTVMRTRPIFNTWATRVEVVYDDEEISEDKLGEMLLVGGKIVGLCDWRPKHGQFDVLELTDDKEVKKTAKALGLK